MIKLSRYDLIRLGLLCLLVSNSADAAVVRSFFTVHPQELFKGFYPYVCAQREKWNNPTIAAEVETFYIGKNNETCK